MLNRILYFSPGAHKKQYNAIAGGEWIYIILHKHKKKPSKQKTHHPPPPCDLGKASPFTATPRKDQI